jgi:hypothetical protein
MPVYDKYRLASLPFHLLARLMEDYGHLVERMPGYPWTAERMTREWIALFEALLDDRAAMVARRRMWRDPWTALVNQIPI